MSDAALRRAARLGDGWLGAGQSPDQAVTTLERFGTLRREAGRATVPFDAVVPLTVPPTTDVLKRLEDAGAGGSVSYPFTFVIGPTSTLEQKRAYLESYAANVIRPLRG